MLGSTGGDGSQGYAGAGYVVPQSDCRSSTNYGDRLP
jgi:hypothetical protein